MSRFKPDFIRRTLPACALLAAIVPLGAHAAGPPSTSNLSDDPRCVDGPAPVYSAVEFDVTNLPVPGGKIAVRAVMTQPVRWQWLSRGGGSPRGCFMAVEDAPGIVLLHGSDGKGTTAPFYTTAFQQLFTTIAPELFAAQTADGFARPPLPIFNYSHAFGALNFLADAEGPIGPDGRVQQGAAPVAGQPYKVKVNPDAVGCIGFSWGGVVCNQTAVEIYADQFGRGAYGTPYRFAAHVANYPVCYGRNIPAPPTPPNTPPSPTPWLWGSLFGINAGEILEDAGVPGLPRGPGKLTGAPLLIQVGDSDDYDNDNDSEMLELQSGSLSCLALRDNLEPDERRLVKVRVIEGAEHGFDRVYSLPFTGADPFGQLGTEILNPEGAAVVLGPDLRTARKARSRAKRFFYQNLY